MLLNTGCGVNIVSNIPATQAPQFVTATLPPSAVPPPTVTLLPPSPQPTIPPIEGTTTTQLNVRAQTSTASETLGMVDPFSKVQVTGKDPSGSWYQILYGSGTGWVRAEYVQVPAGAQIPVISDAAGSGSGLTGLVLQKINVRNGPAASYASLGVLNPKDVVFITGRDSSGTWMQIEFSGSPDGHGWAALEFLQVDGVDALPVVAEAEQPIATAVTSESTPAAVVRLVPAAQDGDSLQAPLTAGVFSAAGIRNLQIQGNVSAPEGDLEDWIQFITTGQTLSLRLSCSSGTFILELWKDSALERAFPQPCGEKQLIITQSNHTYALRLSEATGGELHITQYTLSLEAIQ